MREKKNPGDALLEDRTFASIWRGGLPEGCRLVLRCQLGEDAQGRILYNGRPFNRSSWTWRPPKFIRLQGRLARENSDPRNNNPEISLYTQDGEVLKLDVCPCGGELLIDRNGYLYCEKCCIIYNNHDRQL